MSLLRLLGRATLLALAGAGWMIASELDRRRQRRSLHEEVERWEDEGGNVRDVDTVSPRVRSTLPGA